MRDTRYKMPAEKRKFGGKVYTYLILGTKAESENDAAHWRKRGFSVRIAPWGRLHAVYTRR